MRLAARHRSLAGLGRPRLRRVNAVLTVCVLAGAGTSACSSSDDATGPRATTTVAPTITSTTIASTTTTPAATAMRGKRYCEVLLVRPTDGRITADVYNTYPLNECPEDQWTRLDAATIATERGVPFALLNGPRHWLMDSVEKTGGVADLERTTFGDIEMYRQASVDVGPIAEATKPYTPHNVDRDTVFVFDAGRTVYELTTADGTVYVMQTWSQQKDPGLAESGLATLGARLQLPAGWTYAPRLLDDELRIVTTETNAHVLQDDLGNSYSEVAAP